MSNRRTSRPKTARPSRAAGNQEGPVLFDLPPRSGETVDLDAVGALVREVVSGFEEFEHAIDAEECAGLLLGLGRAAGLDDPSWLRSVQLSLATLDTAQADGLRVTIAALTDEPSAAGVVGDFAARTTGHAWTAELAEPVSTLRCLSLNDQSGACWALAAEFSRAGDTHAFVLAIEPDECGAVAGIFTVNSDQVAEALQVVRDEAASHQLTLVESGLDPAEFRWRAESAMDAREVHDADAPPDAEDLFRDLMSENGPGYYALAPIFSARLRSMPAPRKAKRPHGGQSVPDFIASFQSRYGKPWGLTGAYGLPIPRQKLPARTRYAPGGAPILRLRVDLRGTKPPIWRRLEVPADMTLVRLHHVLQAAFDWTNDHLHVFETPFGSFGDTDPDLDHRPDKSVAVEQVAGVKGDTITYTYDFGDDWVHKIKVEQVLPRQDGVSYPRCSGGRRAGPPEDCGGIWGYADLLAILADPSDEEHASRLEWLGLERGDRLDPEEFDLELINQRISASTHRRGGRTRS